MNVRFAKNYAAGIFFLALLLCLPVSAFAVRPGFASHEITGAAPNIDGDMNAGEWPGAPQIVFDGNMPPTEGYTYVIPTYVYFSNDLTNIYVLADVVGDTTDDGGIEAATLGPLDECLLILANGDDYILTEGFGNGASCPPGVTFAAGFGASPNSATPHRMFEFQVPLSAIGATPGQTIDFCSPHNSKYRCFFQTGSVSGGGSLGYDASNDHDNIWPPGLIEVNDMSAAMRGSWGLVQLQPTQQQSVPTLSEWGMILMGLFLAGAAVWTIKRKDAGSAATV